MLTNKALYFLLIVVLGMLLCSSLPVNVVGAASASPVSASPTPESPIPTPTASFPDSKIESLQAKVDTLEVFVEVQSRSYDAAVSRMESNLNLLLAIMAIASVVIALLGFGVVQLWIRHLIETQLRQATSEQVKRVAQAELDRTRKEWEPKFAELYEEYRKTIPRK